ncbi:MAG: ABC transporter permease [Alphaproteobacteria bacterium]
MGDHLTSAKAELRGRPAPRNRTAESEDRPLWRNGADPRRWAFCAGSWARKENKRWINIYLTSVLSPQSSILLMLAAFWLAGAPREMMQFLAPGAVAAATIFNSFLNASSSILIQREDGALGDLLMSPLSPIELALGNLLGGVGRGLAVGALGLCLLVPFGLIDLQTVQPLSLLGGLCLLACLGASFGGIFGFGLKTIDRLMGVINYLVTPLTFLSLTWISVHSLPDSLYWPAVLNPFAGATEMLRYGVSGSADLPFWLRCYLPLVGIALFTTVTTLVIRDGRTLKA